MYNKHCPLKYSQPKVAKLNLKNAWFTKELKNACSKKNKLFKAFLLCRIINSETRYKTYKNKLTGILRSTTKKLYFNSVFEEKEMILLVPGKYKNM